MLIDGHFAASQREAPLCFLNLQDAISILDRVVTSHGALIMEGEDELKILALAGGECGPDLLRLVGKLGIEEGDITGAQKLIGRRQGVQIANPQTLVATAPARCESFVHCARVLPVSNRGSSEY